jgi:hypothetical protein
MERKKGRCDIIRLKTPQQYAKTTNQCIKMGEMEGVGTQYDTDKI